MKWSPRIGGGPIKTQQIVIVDVDRGRVSYDVYEVRASDLRGHGMVVDDEPAESVIERLNAYFGGHAVVARHIPRRPDDHDAGIERRG